MSRLWYRTPAEVWVESLPVGNGRLGAMVPGRVDVERLQLNEDTLWSGGRQDSDNPAALEALPKVRELLFAGRFQEAQALADAKLVCSSHSDRGFGCYQMLGDLVLEFPAVEDPEEDRREGDNAPEGRELAQEAPPLRYPPNEIEGALYGIEQGNGGDGKQ